MAKLTPVILEEDPNEFGTWNVKIRIGHKSKNAYLSTSEFVGKKHLKDRAIKPSFIVTNLTDILNSYNEILKRHKFSLPNMSHLQVKELLEKNGNQYADSEEIMFLAFCDQHIKSWPVESTASILRTVYLRLYDYTEGKDIQVRMITSSFLKGYEDYLRQPATLKRMSNGRFKTLKVEGLGNTGIHGHMNRFKLLFNAAKEKYNDEEIGLIPIPNNPFKKYKIPEMDDVPARDFTADQIVKIRDCKTKPGTREEMVRDLWMLSFYLCGMNACDMLRLPCIAVDRVEYNRQKTENKRSDKAFISVKLIDEAKEIYHKYIGNLNYSNGGSLNNAIYYGMKKLRSTLGEGFEDLDFYSARHSVATIAANECGFSVDAIGKALNHGESKRVVTNRYIRKSWKTVDEIQAAVVSLLPVSGSQEFHLTGKD